MIFISMQFFGKGNSGAKGGGAKKQLNTDLVVDDVTKFKNIKAADKAMKEDYDSWKKNLTAEQEEALYAYTDVFYIDINSSLREPVFYKDHINAMGQDEKTTKQQVKAITSAIKNYELTQDIKVTRQIRLDTGDLEKLYGSKFLTEGQLLKDPGFMSTAASGGGGTGNALIGNVNLNIKVPKGKGRGAYLNPLSKHKDESEFLLQRGSTIRLDKVKRKSISNSDNLHWYTIEATLVGNDID